MLRKLLSIMFILTLPLFYFGCGSDDGGENGNGPTPPPPQRVEVTAQDNPGLGSVNSAVWDSLEAAEIIIGTNSDYNANLLNLEQIVEMKALVAEDTLLYIWAKWNDSQEDIRFGEIRGSWINDQVQWVINNEDTVFRNEDRLYIMFDNGGTNGADCAQFCHTSMSAADRYMYGASGDNVDIWQWKAHRTGLVGFADDMNLTTTMISGDPQDQVSDSLYFRNYDDWFLRPRYMAPGGPDDTTSGLLEGQWALFDGNLDWMTFIPNQPPTAKPLPGYYLNNLSSADGSRWDVNTVSEHDGSTWTVVFCRKFNTGDADDIEFDFSGLDSVMISIGISDNSGVEHRGRQPFPLVFMP